MPPPQWSQRAPAEIETPVRLRALPAAEGPQNGQIPNAGGSNPPVGLGGSRITGIRRLTGNLYRNGRLGGFGALQAPATN
jgi:hypothetical protein